MTTMLLKNLIDNLNFKIGNEIVKGVSSDSRNVKKGDLFVSIKGNKFDGNEYIEEALSKYHLSPKYKSGTINYSFDDYLETMAPENQEVNKKRWVGDGVENVYYFNQVDWDYYHPDVQERVYKLVREGNCWGMLIERMMHRRLIMNTKESAGADEINSINSLNNFLIFWRAKSCNS